MKVIISGGNGQLGQDCLSVLEKKHQVYSFSSRELDITNSEKVKTIFEEILPEVVINCAAYTAVDLCETEKEKCWAVNAEGPEKLARGCKHIKAKLIHISTDYVFDGSKPITQVYNENDQVGPVSQYGQSKLAGEENIRKINADHLIIRTAWLYGISGKNFLKTMLRLAAADSARTLKVVNDQFGSLTWTHSLARQISHLLTSEITGTIHATAEGHSTWYEAATTFLTMMDIPYSIEPCTTADYPTPARRPTNSILENQLLKHEKLNIMAHWRDDLQEFVNRYKKDLLAEL
ncbi:MAG: dTDP-4-dehydrorhamnose reductase [Desulfobulbaceae bacterium]|nr:dTDP-4-dehydrorhamnose reductase [Desulfobulbaceae bacterium]